MHKKQSVKTSLCAVQVENAEALVNTTTTSNQEFNVSGLELHITAAQITLTAPANHDQCKSLADC